MGILRMNEEQILQRTGTGPLFQFLRNMTSRLYNVNELAKVGDRANVDATARAPACRQADRVPGGPWEVRGLHGRVSVCVL